VQTTRPDTPAHTERSTQAPASGPIHLVVDLNRCQAYAQCCFLAPEVFRLHGDEALWYDPSPDREQWEHVLRAAAACPVQAIIVQGPAAMRHRPRKHPGYTDY
jgi:ferredoxin